VTFDTADAEIAPFGVFYPQDIRRIITDMVVAKHLTYADPYGEGDGYRVDFEIDGKYYGVFVSDGQATWDECDEWGNYPTISGDTLIVCADGDEFYLGDLLPPLTLLYDTLCTLQR
jgi:hypothetical protein